MSVDTPQLEALLSHAIETAAWKYKQSKRPCTPILKWTAGLNEHAQPEFRTPIGDGHYYVTRESVNQWSARHIGPVGQTRELGVHQDASTCLFVVLCDSDEFLFFAGQLLWQRDDGTGVIFAHSDHLSARIVPRNEREGVLFFVKWDSPYAPFLYVREDTIPKLKARAGMAYRNKLENTIQPLATDLGDLPWRYRETGDGGIAQAQFPGGYFELMIDDHNFTLACRLGRTTMLVIDNGPFEELISKRRVIPTRVDAQRKHSKAEQPEFAKEVLERLGALEREVREMRKQLPMCAQTERAAEPPASSPAAIDKNEPSRTRWCERLKRAIDEIPASTPPRESRVLVDVLRAMTSMIEKQQVRDDIRGRQSDLLETLVRDGGLPPESNRRAFGIALAWLHDKGLLVEKHSRQDWAILFGRVGSSLQS